MKAGEECEPIDSEVRELHPLLPNDPEITLLSVEDEPLQVVTRAAVVSGNSGSSAR